MFKKLIFILLLMLIPFYGLKGHPGGLDSKGCHGGSKPYHCHRAPSDMVGNRLRCDLGSRSKECISSSDAITSFLEPETNENKIELFTEYETYIVDGHPNWSIIKYYPNTSKEYIVAITKQSNKNGSIRIQFSPESGCSELIYFSLEMASNYLEELDAIGNISIKFDNEAARVIETVYSAQKGSKWLSIHFTAVKSQILGEDSFLFRLNDFVKDEPSYNFSLSGSRDAYTIAKNICLNTNTYKLN